VLRPLSVSALHPQHVPALYLATAMALQGMTKQELEALKLRIEEKRV
jgi:hypothetical protein